MTTSDLGLGDVRLSGDLDRDWVVIELRSGNPAADDHPVHRRRMTERGQLVRKRAYEAKDLFACAVDDDGFDQLKAALAMQSWSIAYATFLMHGFWVQPTEAEAALHSLRRASARMANVLLETHDWLAKALSPQHASHPDELIFVASALPADLLPARGVLAWRIFENLLDERAALLEELRTLRKERFSFINEGGAERHKVRRKKKSDAVVDRAETHLAVLALDRFKDERSSLDIARRVNKLTESALSKLGADDKPDVRLTKPEALERRLKERWEELGLSAPDGRRAPKQTVK